MKLAPSRPAVTRQPPSPAPPLATGPRRTGSRVVAAAGRYLLVWLSVAIVAATEHPLDAGDFVGASVAAAVWLANLRIAFAGVPYAVGPGVPSMIGTATGLVCVAALNEHVVGLDLGPVALLGAALGVLVSIAVWEHLLERTLSRLRVLVIGTTEFAEVADAAKRARRMALDVLGGESALRSLDSLTEVVTVQRPDLVVLADGQASSAALDRLLDIADGRFRVAGLTSFYEYALGRVPLHQITPMWFISLLHVRQRPYARWVKRAFDLVSATLILVLTALLLPLIALAVSRTPGPIIYRQVRVGDRGRRFTIYKFRTMVDRAELPGEAVWAQDAGPSDDAGRRVPAADASGRATAAGQRAQGGHVDGRPAPGASRVHRVAGGRHPVLEPPAPDQAGDDGQPAQVRCGYASDVAAMQEKLAYDF